MSAKHTPGPWGWFGNAKGNHVYLATIGQGRTYVMGFERWGMRSAQPTFRDGDRMRPAADLLTFEVGDGDAVGVEAARANSSVYRLDVRGIKNADARLIAAAPELLAALRLHQAWADSERAGPDYGGQTRDTHPDGEAIWRRWWDGNLDLCARANEATSAAIAKAEGRS